MTFPLLPLRMGNPGDTPSHRSGEAWGCSEGWEFLAESFNSLAVRFHQLPALSSTWRILGSNRWATGGRRTKHLLFVACPLVWETLPSLLSKSSCVCMQVQAEGSRGWGLSRGRWGLYKGLWSTPRAVLIWDEGGRVSRGAQAPRRGHDNPAGVTPSECQSWNWEQTLFGAPCISVSTSFPIFLLFPKYDVDDILWEQ